MEEPKAKKRKFDDANCTSQESKTVEASVPTVFVLQAGIGKARTKLFQKQIKKLGGNVIFEFSSEESRITHILVDEKMEVDRMCRILKIPSSKIHAKVVKTLWLSNSIRNNKFIDSDDFVIPIPLPDEPEESVDTEEQLIQGSKSGTDNSKDDTLDKQTMPKVGTMFGFMKKSGAADEHPDADSDYETSEDENDKQEEDTKTTFSKPLPKGSWVCAHSSHNPRPNFNKHITDKLEALAKTYENTNDKWRALGYSKAIMALKKYPKPITTWEEAKALHGVGAKLADKIWEICESGELRKLDELSSQEDIKVINLFTGVWGAGATTARAWLAQGFRTLDDLRTKANLTRHQKIGLQYYDELLDRMPRSEAAEIEDVVVSAAKSINKDLIAMACGSYRRGKPTCGDVDVLVTHPDGKSHVGVFSVLLAKLKETGFLTDDLVSQEDSGNQKKYLGVCKLPGENRKHRRLDIIVVPYAEYACAIMYFTGSAHFNRSMRNLAGKMGMSLNEHSLNTGVVRKSGEKINKGTPVPTPTEESVFEHLGLKYRPPTERDH